LYIFYTIGVVVLDGLLYVIGGSNKASIGQKQLDSVEIYNPKSNTWTIQTISIRRQRYAAVVVNRPLHL
jgi:kelch-like protein 2/3